MANASIYYTLDCKSINSDDNMYIKLMNIIEFTNGWALTMTDADDDIVTEYYNTTELNTSNIVKTWMSNNATYQSGCFPIGMI